MEGQNKKENKKMKTKIIGKVLLSLGLVFVLGSAITQVRGDSSAKPRLSSCHYP